MSTTTVPGSKFSFKRVVAPVATAPVAPVVAPVNPGPAPVPAPVATPVAAPVAAPVEIVASVPVAAQPVAPVVPTPAAPAPVVAPAPAPVANAHTPAISGTSLPPVAPAQGAVTEYRKPASYGDDSDNVSASDVNLPRLNIVQKVGDLSNIFLEGDIVLNKELVILNSPKGDKSGACLRVVLCGLRSDRYAEKTVGGARGDIVDTEEEVLKKGATTDYNLAQRTGIKLYQPLAEGLFLVERPAGCVDPSFNKIIDGKFYLLALWSMKGTAFTNGAKIFRTARKLGWLKDEYNADGSVKVVRGYYSGVWELRTELAQFGTNFAWKPSLRKAEYCSPAVAEFASQSLS